MEVQATKEEETQTETPQQRKLDELVVANYFITDMYDWLNKIGDTFGDHLYPMAGKLREEEELTAGELILVQKLEAEQEIFWTKFKMFKEGLSDLNECLWKLADKIDPHHKIDF